MTKIIIHKDLKLSMEEARQLIRREKPLGDLFLDVGEHFISISSGVDEEGRSNIFGQYGEGTDYILLGELPASELKQYYKRFPKVYIGSSDVASLILRAPCNVKELYFGADNDYDAYECFGDNVEIGGHYEKVFSGEYWLKIYDDRGLTYDKDRAFGFTNVDVYRAGEMGCIIHWHN